MTIWYILCLLGTFFPVLVSCVKKNPATLIRAKFSPVTNLGYNLELVKRNAYRAFSSFFARVKQGCQIFTDKMYQN
jgi:hypothetical protein